MKHERKLILARPYGEDGVEIRFGTWVTEGEDPKVGYHHELVTVTYQSDLWASHKAKAEGQPYPVMKARINWSATGEQPIGPASFFAALMQEAVFTASLLDNGSLNAEMAVALFAIPEDLK
jgi:hypothetical protein